MINRAGLLITFLMGGLTILLWAVVNQPDVEPPWPETIQGFCFSPMREAQTPMPGQFPSIAEIDEDLALLAGEAYAVRTYTVDSTLAEVASLAGAHQLNVMLGAWINQDEAANNKEIEKLIRVYRDRKSVV